MIWCRVTQSGFADPMRTASWVMIFGTVYYQMNAFATAGFTLNKKK